ncbi:MAG TPA: insecticidal toxin protein [Accumulibacter sp.]|nr:insecticidal toxin protein [Accumulibacter sp.]
MNPYSVLQYGVFHGQAQSEFAHVKSRVVETRETRHYFRRSRELSYSFFLHQHPYVQTMMQRLLRQGTSGLQALDTEFVVRVELAGKLAYLLPENTLTVQPSNAVLRFAGRHLLKLSDGTIVKPALAPNTVVTLQKLARLRTPSGQLKELTADTDAKLIDGAPRPALFDDFFKTLYQPSGKVKTPHPAKDLDFSPHGAYSVYNWELFFHVPLTLALHLSKNGRFAEAQRWLHLLFDPTDSSDGPAPERFWKVLPFLSLETHSVEQLLVNLAKGANGDVTIADATRRSIEDWMNAPFRPHAVARQRQQAYMVKTVMAYLDNLIAWGDSLFRQDKGEAIDEAMMLYVLAANILGPRPQAVPRKGRVKPQTYNNLRGDLQLFGSVLRDLEPELPFDLLPTMAAPPATSGQALASLRSMGQSLYFCVPRNDKLLGYWDTVADRLFKIRNSLNLQGVFRQLPLFEPPVDPALLARAAASGLDVGAIVNGLNQPLPLVRCALLLQKATELAQQVTAIGAGQLSAMEKEEGEALALLRARHEKVLMEMVEQVRYGQWQEAVKAKEGLLQSLALAVQRYSYYAQQLGAKAEDITKSLPVLEELDLDSLEKMRLAATEPALSARPIEVDIASDAFAQVAQALNGGKILSSHEVRESLLLEGAQLSSDIANILNVISSVAHFVPEFNVHVQPMGMGATVQYGGKEVGDAVGATAAAARAVADRLNFEARRAGRIDAFARREREWAFQSNLAVGEINQVFKQIRAAQIREAVANMELRNHRQQKEHAAEIERFLNGEGVLSDGKKTNKTLYAWMKRELTGLHARAFQFAFDVARKAERALQHELGQPGLSYLKFDYQAGRDGLLAGERLLLDIKRMEMAYHEQNQREYELTKHVSLLQADPRALVDLRSTGSCTFQLPESLFDLDGPGHYFRRLKSVSLSIPCVSGPYASVACTLTLLRSSTRISSLLGDGYERADNDDARFSDHFGSVQSIVTSSAQNDSGLFETNLRDERYLPFEYSGAISTWQLRLPADPRKSDPQAFDYAAIADVILHLRLTAREGGMPLRDAAMAALKTRIDAGTAFGSLRLFSLREEFPAVWAKFLGAPAGANHQFQISFELQKQHFPLWSKARLGPMKAMHIWARRSGDAPNAPLKARLVDAADTNVAFPLQGAAGDLLVSGAVADNELPGSATGELMLAFSDKALLDLWVAVRWS